MIIIDLYLATTGEYTLWIEFGPIDIILFQGKSVVFEVYNEFGIVIYPLSFSIITNNKSFACI